MPATKSLPIPWLLTIPATSIHASQSKAQALRRVSAARGQDGASLWTA
jgi:hypothetical protein